MSSLSVQGCANVCEYMKEKVKVCECVQGCAKVGKGV